MTETVNLLNSLGWGWVVWAIVGMFVVTAMLKMLAESKPYVASLLGPLGRYWIDKRDRRESRSATVIELQAEVKDLDRQLAVMRSLVDGNQANADLKQQVEQLSLALKITRWRAEMTDAYLINDEDWHRDVALAGIDMPPRITFAEHERQWRITNPRPTA